MRSFVHLLIVLSIYFGGISANTGEKKKASKPAAKKMGVIQLKDGGVVYKRAEDVKPVQSGKIPNLVLKDGEGRDVKIRELARQKPLLMIFYRGGWCPYCNRQLSDLIEVQDEIKKKGYEIIAVSADRPAKIKEFLKGKDLPYKFLSDSSMKASIALGLAFQVPERLVQTYKNKYSIDLEDSSGEKHHYLPVPAVYVVNSQGEIQFSYANPDYKVRLSNKEVLEAL